MSSLTRQYVLVAERVGLAFALFASGQPLSVGRRRTRDEARAGLRSRVAALARVGARDPHALARWAAAAAWSLSQLASSPPLSARAQAPHALASSLLLSARARAPLALVPQHPPRPRRPPVRSPGGRGRRIPAHPSQRERRGACPRRGATQHERTRARRRAPSARHCGGALAPEPPPARRDEVVSTAREASAWVPSTQGTRRVDKRRAAAECGAMWEPETGLAWN